MSLLKNKLQVIVSLIFLGFVVWWASFQSIVVDQGVSVQRFGATYGVIALIGAIVGFLAARKWGGFRTVLGKALILFSFGLLAQEAGQIILTYYIYGAKIQIPYPSWGDVAYFGSTLCFIGGGIYLAKAAGVKFSLKASRYKVIAALVPAVLLVSSYWALLNKHQYDFSKPLTVFLDFGYPMGDALYISLALVAYLLSRKLLGGVMRRGVMIVIFALVIQYIADFMFIYQSNRGTWLTGRLDDLLYLLAYFLMATAMIQFLAVYYGLKRKNRATSVNVKPPESD